MNNNYAKTYLSIGLLVFICVIGFNFFRFRPVEALENRFYDFCQLFIKAEQHDNNIVCIQIDEESIARLGRMPWPRTYYASLLSNIAAANPKVIGLNLLFSEKEDTLAIREIRNIQNSLNSMLPDPNDATMQVISKYLKETEDRLDHDRKFIQEVHLHAKKLVLPIVFQLNSFSGLIHEPDDTFLNKQSLPLDSNSWRLVHANALKQPFKDLLSDHMLLGHAYDLKDCDGKVRKHLLAIEYKDNIYPSFPVQVLRKYWDITADQIKLKPDEGLYLGEHFIALNHRMTLFCRSIIPQSNIVFYPIYDAIHNSIPKDVLKDKIVLIGANKNLITSYPSMSSIIAGNINHSAQIIQTLLTQSTILKPSWEKWAHIGAMAIFLLYMTFVMPRVTLLFNVIAWFVVMITWSGACLFLFIENGIWLNWNYPMVYYMLCFILCLPMILKIKFIEPLPVKPVIQVDVEEPQLIRYTMEKMIGSGSRGKVYRATPPDSNERIAVKTFRLIDPIRYSEREKAIRQFYTESEPILHLNHAHIVHMIDIGVEDDWCYTAMELLDDNGLEKYYSKYNLLPLPKLIRYMMQICDALDYAHKNWVIHGGIKPSNIILQRNDKIKLTDFGMYRLSSSNIGHLDDKTVNSAYLSPEHIQGKKQDGRSDLFSLGIVFFHLLTGELPFNGETPAELMVNICEKQHPSPKDINPKLPVACEQIINNALEKDITKRYQTAEALNRHLQILAHKMLERPLKEVLSTNRKS